jgi:nucleotide-binding universal stress UspA family protein
MIDNQSDSGPVVVGVDGSERSIEALALADLLGPALGRPVVIVHASRRWRSFRAARRSESGFQGTTRPRRMA